MTLFRDIQNSAIDPNVKLSDLLRKCKVLAARLKNDLNIRDRCAKSIIQ